MVVTSGCLWGITSPPLISNIKSRATLSRQPGWLWVDDWRLSIVDWKTNHQSQGPWLSAPISRWVWLFQDSFCGINMLTKRLTCYYVKNIRNYSGRMFLDRIDRIDRIVDDFLSCQSFFIPSYLRHKYQTTIDDVYQRMSSNTWEIPHQDENKIHRILVSLYPVNLVHPVKRCLSSYKYTIKSQAFFCI